MKKYLLAIAAMVAGRAIGRPNSGKWLAHYLLGSGKSCKLSPKMEAQLLYVAQDGYNRRIPRCLRCLRNPAVLAFEEVKHIPDNVRDAFIVGNIFTSSDLYSTIGDFIIWWQDDNLHYLDVYNWHPDSHWTIDAQIFGLPFAIRIDAKDDIWKPLGKSFITQGTIDTAVMEAEVPPDGCKCSLDLGLSLAKLRRRFQYKIYLPIRKKLTKFWQSLESQGGHCESHN